MSKEKSEAPKMITWEKKDGTEVVTNSLPANVVKAESLGWKRKK